MPDVIYQPLTPPQMSIWNTEMTYPGTSISNVAGTLRIKEYVHFDVLEQAINLFLKANDGIRIRLSLDKDGAPRQYVSEYSAVPVELKDFSAFEDPLKALYEWDSMMASVPMELFDKDLYRVYMVKINEQDGGFFINTHHIISDACSINQLGSEVMRHYLALLKGEDSDVAMPSYMDCVRKQSEYYQSKRFEKDSLYWNSLFNEKPEMTILKSNSNSVFSTVSKRKAFVLPRKFINKLESFCAEHKYSKYQVFVAGLAAYIFRVTSQKNIVVGTPILNRSTADEKKTIGMFISTVPLKVTMDDSMNFESFLKVISSEIFKLLRHQKYPYERLLKETRQKHGMTDNLFDIVISYQNSKFIIDKDIEYSSRWHFNGHQANSLTIHINDRDDGGDLIIDYDYHANLYFDKEIEFIQRHMLSLLWHALDSPTKDIAKLDMISENEKDRILHHFNNTKAEYDMSLTIHRIFERQVSETPDAVALQFQGTDMTYGELNEKANRVAWKLMEHGVTPDMPVGIIAYRSFEMIIGVLAILKAGGAYVPIDPKAPSDRIEYIVNNSGVKVVITACDKAFDLPGVSAFGVSDLLSDVKVGSGNLPDTSNSRSLCYIIYTSGSTGQPKGVMIEHYSVVNRIGWMQKEYPIDEQSCILQKTPYTFDVSVWELFWWSFVGARLAILEPEGEKNPEALLDAITSYRVTTMHFVPSMFNSFIDFLTAKSRWSEIEPVIRIFASGEALALKTVSEFLQHRTGTTDLVNLYGPTEAAVDVTHYRCTSESLGLRSIPIGKPIDNIQLYILDNYLTIQPIGTVGELYISGDGLARGYINRPDLTEASFISNPYLSGKLMYKTGDLARWYPEGDIEYIGRSDHQIKIRGHRVELNEIKLQILKDESVKDALIICKDRDGTKHIYAYLIFHGEGNVDVIRNNLRKVFPTYMVPSFFIPLSEYPLSENGKVDLKRLPEPQIVGQEHVGPRTGLESELMQIWEDVLRVDVPSVESDFFDLGGDSLTAIQLITRLEGVSIEDVYMNPTIEQLANCISGKNHVGDQILIPYKRFDKKSESAFIGFPYGGGSSIIYQELFKELSKLGLERSLYSVNLPGHGSVVGEQDFITLDEAADRIVRMAVDLGIKDAILYGHCVGSALTMLTADKLQNEGIQVRALCMGGILPPKFAKYYGKHVYPWAFFSDKFMMNYLSRIGFNVEQVTDDVMPLIISAFRYDVKNFYRFFYDIGRKNFSNKNVPIYSIMGGNDPMTRGYSRNYLDWQQYSERATLKVIPDAGHYFIKSHATSLAEILLDVQGENADA